MNTCLCTHNVIHHSYATGCVVCDCTRTPTQVEELGMTEPNVDRLIVEFWEVQVVNEQKRTEQQQILNQRRQLRTRKNNWRQP